MSTYLILRQANTDGEWASFWNDTLINEQSRKLTNPARHSY
ncbi:MAG: hypothetical protein NT013_30510 [Planctomycetia bacterium]|nr:hypothetical protein [Planctomycetia bacterium]